jgi:hypothetical protein
MRTENQAIAAAKRLLKKMKTSGWEIVVWENLGWHYKLVRGNICLYEHESMVGKPTYWTLRGYDGAGEMYLTHNYERHTDPNKAVTAQLNLALAHVGHVQKLIEASGPRGNGLATQVPDPFYAAREREAAAKEKKNAVRKKKR